MIPKTCGDLRTCVQVQFPCTISQPGYPEKVQWIDIGSTSSTAPPRYKHCMWVGVHGTQAFVLGQERAIDMATLTFRYDERINEKCRVLKSGKEYSIISVDHVRQRGQWTEIKVKRVVSG